jgi:hypothetical protein
MNGFLALMAPDGRLEDRRKGLRALMEGAERQKAVQALFEIAQSGWRLEVEPVAIRGSRLSLIRATCRDTDAADRPITIEFLTVLEVGADERVYETVSFDLDDISDAFEELDARYLGGEAAAHSHTWSVITRVCATLSGREFAGTTPDWVNIDHRRGTAFAPGEMFAYIRAAWDQTPDIGFYIQAVHRLTDCGAVVTGAANGTSREGFVAEWRTATVVTVEGDLINRCEMFDEADIDSALARFDELDRPAPQFGTAADPGRGG